LAFLNGVGVRAETEPDFTKGNSPKNLKKKQKLPTFAKLQGTVQKRVGAATGRVRERQCNAAKRSRLRKEKHEHGAGTS